MHLRRYLWLAVGLLLPALAAAAALPDFDATTSLLVVSPHPDDEVLCCAGVIQRVVQAGGKVSVVWVTSGDASELDLIVIEKSLVMNPAKMRDLATRRMQEARAAASHLGVAADRLFFLGYPDRGVLRLLTDHYATPYTSKFTAASSVPYDKALSPRAPYTGESLERDFEKVLDRVRPTLVLAPSPRDSHTDHQAAGILTMRALSHRKELPNVRYWIVHGGELWPLPRGYHPTLTQTTPPRGKGLDLMPFQLTTTEEGNKVAALHEYQTQMTVMSSYLLSFVRKTELFSPTPMPAN
ncbi:MAG TPA: PIG-L family deacetylase [Steroidobacteraceae bacterium]|jgi:LmbE family N-acetylglucosaminyl deacetylase